MDRIAVESMRKRKQYITQEIPQCHPIHVLTAQHKPAIHAGPARKTNVAPLPKSFPESADITGL